jgi:hypothetical protein
MPTLLWLASGRELSGFERKIVNLDKREALRIARGIGSSST